ncbi:MAG: ribose 5-phosphate isomerase B [Lachnospiraceae bacterium]|nr:ribose 5-phosphate isomerase B [Lachnospiraceae bacterium]
MLAIGCDQAGYELKQEIMKYLEEKGIAYKDCGTYSADAVDYPVYARAVVNEILSGNADKGILICGTGIGMSMTANRYKGIRAALCGDCFSAEATRLHNDANILCMGARVTGPGLAVKITETFLNTAFSGAERHARRVKMIDEAE